MDCRGQQADEGHSSHVTKVCQRIYLECLPDEEAVETCDSPTPDNLQCKLFHSLLGDHTAGIQQRVLLLQKAAIRIR